MALQHNDHLPNRLSYRLTEIWTRFRGDIAGFGPACSEDLHQTILLVNYAVLLGDYAATYAN